MANNNNNFCRSYILTACAEKRVKVYVFIRRGEGESGWQNPTNDTYFIDTINPRCDFGVLLFLTPEFLLHLAITYFFNLLVIRTRVCIMYIYIYAECRKSKKAYVCVCVCALSAEVLSRATRRRSQFPPHPAVKFYIFFFSFIFYIYIYAQSIGKYV